MNIFEISPEQASRIIVGVIADELGASFKRYTDFLTLASWSGETALDAGGIGLSGDERAQSAAAVERFFDIDAGALDEPSARTVGCWAQKALAAIGDRLLRLSFKPHGRDSGVAPTPHPAADVFRDAASAANLLHGRRRVVSMVGPQGYLGFVTTVLAPNLLRVSSVDLRSWGIDDIREALVFGDAVVATPTTWRYLIREGLRAPDNSIGVAFGEPLTPELGAEMRKSGFGALRELYGSTECGLVAWRDTLSEPFTLFDHWRRDGDDIARLTPEGARTCAPMDALDWVDERSFRIGPRRDGAVQICAVNVFPERIAAVVSGHPSVETCRILVTRQTNGLNRLEARVRLKRGQPASERVAREIDGWCRTQLRPPERPRIYRFEE
jgi:4-coumarate--CoA ligase (photoactive yellow protein activation family)